MATTNYQTGTVVSSLWLNDVDYTVYTALPFAGDAAISAAGSVLVSNGTGYEQQSSAAFLATINMEIGTDVQAWDTHLDEFAALTPVDNGIIVGNSTPAWVVESGATARTSLGLGTGDNVTFTTIDGTAITGSGAVTGDTVVGTNGVTSNGNAVKEVGRETIWLPAHSWVPATTNGPSLGQTETTTNALNFKTLDFDATTVEIAWFQVEMPKNWNEGTIIAKFHWTAASGSGTVTWDIAGVCISNDDALDAACGTAVSVTDTLITAEDDHVTAETSAVTLAGTPAEGDITLLRIRRDVTDTLAVDAQLIGVSLYITTNAANDD